jgi:hypothetical protein
MGGVCFWMPADPLHNNIYMGANNTIISRVIDIPNATDFTIILFIINTNVKANSESFPQQ